MTLATLYGCQFAQPALPCFASLVYPTPRRGVLGWMGEMTVQRQLKTSGYVVRLGRRGEGDLHVIDPRTGQTLRVEVKTAMRSIDRKWRFTLWKNRCTDYRNSDLVVLLAVLDDFTFVTYAIPVPDLGARSQLCITSHPATYAGWLSPYRLPPTADLLPLDSPPHVWATGGSPCGRGAGGGVSPSPLAGRGSGGGVNGVSESPLPEVTQ